MAIHVLIAEDQSIVLGALAALLRGQHTARVARELHATPSRVG